MGNVLEIMCSIGWQYTEVMAEWEGNEDRKRTYKQGQSIHGEFCGYACIRPCGAKVDDCSRSQPLR